jgi:hypothetical protein
VASLAAEQLTRTYRRQNLVLRAQTVLDLRKLWPQLRWEALDTSFPSLLTSVGLLVRRDRERSMGLATSYVRAFRLVEGVPGQATIALADPLPDEQLAASLHATSVAAVKRSKGIGMAERAALENAFVMASGSVSRLVLNAGRQTVMRSVIRDLRGKGWERVTSGGCSFCRMLAGRGSVYTEESADFNAHDHCACSAQPVYL